MAYYCVLDYINQVKKEAAENATPEPKVKIKERRVCPVEVYGGKGF